MKKEEIPLDEKGSFFGPDYVPAFESKEGNLVLDYDEDFEESILEHIYRENTFEIAKGSLEDLSYSIRMGPYPDGSDYRIKLEINSSLPLNVLSGNLYLLDRIDYLEELERRFNERFDEEFPELSKERGMFLDTGLSHFCYSGFLNAEDIPDPSDKLREIGEIASKSFKFYKDFTDELKGREGVDGDSSSMHSATSLVEGLE